MQTLGEKFAQLAHVCYGNSCSGLPGCFERELTPSRTARQVTDAVAGIAERMLTHILGQGRTKSIGLRRSPQSKARAKCRLSDVGNWPVSVA